MEEKKDEVVESGPPCDAAEETKTTDSSNKPEPNTDEVQYPKGPRLVGCVAGLVFAASCYSLDETIISTAIPRISDEFHAIGDIGWYGAAFLATMCVCQPIFGKIYTACPLKQAFLIAVLLFEVGNAVSGSAQSSTTVIAGRAITGAGCAGMNSGTWVIVSKIVTLRRRPLLISAIGSIYGVAAIVGPLLGGILTQHVSWRWVFYVNLPLGAVTMALIAVFFHDKSERKSSAEIASHLLNPTVSLGAVLLATAVATLLVALQLGGVQYSWTNSRTIALFATFAVCTVAFVALQIWRPEGGIVPLHIVRQRSVAAAFVYAFCAGAASTILIYYLPLWMQAVKGMTPSRSGILLIPFLLGFVVFALVGGLFVSKIGYYVPAMLAGTVPMSIGAGVLSTLSISSSRAEYIGYQILFAAGTGLGNNQPLTAVQTVLDDDDVPLGTSTVALAQTLGAAVFLVVAQNVFVRHLLDSLQAVGWDTSSQDVLSMGATKLIDAASENGSGMSADVLMEAYNSSIGAAFWVALGLTVATGLGPTLMEWRSVRKGSEEKPAAEVEVEVEVEEEEEAECGRGRR